MRAVLGAGRGRIASQLLTESALLAGAGCLLGLVLARAGIGPLISMLHPRLESFVYGGFETVSIGGDVVLFSAAAAVFSSLLLGLIPALEASRPGLNEALKASARRSAGGGRAGRTRDLLVVSQVALAVLLLISAGLMLRSLWTLETIDRGISTENLLTMQIWPPENKYAEPREIADFQRRILERLRELPEALAASAVSFLPLSEAGVGWQFAVAGRPSPPPEERPHALYYVVEPGFCRTIGIPLLRRKYHSETDGAEGPLVAVIDRKLADRHWHGENPVGRQLKFDPLYAESPWHAALRPERITVVGVVETIKPDGLWENGAPVMYLPYQQHPSRMMHLVVRTGSDPLHLANAVRSKVWEVDADQPVSFVRTMDDVPDWAFAERRLTMQLLMGFAALAVLLAQLSPRTFWTFAREFSPFKAAMGRPMDRDTDT